MMYGRKSVTKKLLAILMVIAMLISVLQKLPINAADPIGKLNGQSYTSFEKMLSDLKSNYKDKSVTIEMLCNWNAANSSAYDKRIYLPEGCWATLNMHGFVFNRNRAWNSSSTGSGDLFQLDPYAHLTINGASNQTEKQIEHRNVATYSTTYKDGKAGKMITTYGATLTGGCNTSGAGCIQLEDHCELILNDVTIAGCSSMDGTIFNGFGGGIYIKEQNSTVRLNNSIITGCLADQDGGGIYCDDDPTVVELNNSEIYRNYASRNGGGLYINDNETRVSGRAESKISSNQSGENGGGVYFCDTDVSLSGFEVSDNWCLSNGGGLYSNKKSVSMSNLLVTKNSCGENGGGIYIGEDKNTISNCEITENKATGSGGGVYVYKNVDDSFSVTGRTIVKDNTAKGMGNQFHISDSAPEDTRVNFSLTKGAEVYLSYGSLGSRDSVMVTQGKVDDTIKSPNCIRYLHPSNGGWHFTYNSAPNKRKIYYVRDGKDTPATGDPDKEHKPPTEVKAANAAPTIVGQVAPGGDRAGTEYNLIRGYSRHQETDSDDNDSASCFYYSDALFDDDPYTYNQHLGTASLNLAYAGMYMRAMEPVDANGNYYYNKHASGRQFLADIGCPDQNIYVNDSNEKKPQTDSIGVTIASKQLAYADGTETGYTLIPVVVRGGGYELEWASNATLDTATDTTDRDCEAKGFSSAADQVCDEIDKYIKKYELEDEIAEGKVKFWVAGYSRAGATANITSKRLVEKYADGTAGKNNQVFGYTLEAPMGGTDVAEKLTDKTKYYCIHNLINAVDIVPLVAPELMGFKRYGVDHYIPGTEAGVVKSENKFDKPEYKKNPPEKKIRSGVNGPTSLTVYRDNDIIYAKNINKNTKDRFLTQLEAMDSGIVFDDYFHPMAMKFITSVSIYEAGNYEGNHVENFIQDFLRFAQEGINPGQDVAQRQTIPNRDEFWGRYQPALRDILALVFTMDADNTQGVIGRISSIMDGMSSLSGYYDLIDIYWNVICHWEKCDKSKKEYYYTFFWNRIVSTGALDFLDDTQKAKLQKNFPALCNMAFTLVSADHNYITEIWNQSQGWAKGANNDESMLIGTFATYSGYILQNHYPEVNMAWARTYDSYYENETTEYTIVNDGYSVDIPAASGKNHDGSAAVLQEGADKNNNLYGDQKIVLEVENIEGEAVYYDLINNSTGAQLTTNLLYRGGVDLALGDGNYCDYTIKTYAISYGVRSDVAVYNIRLNDDRHLVTVIDMESNPTYNHYNVGDNVTVMSGSSDIKYFTTWQAMLWGRDGSLIETDITQALFGNQVLDQDTAVFRMPEVDSEYDTGKKYPDGYALRIRALSEFKVNRINASPAGPVAGQALAETTSIRLYPYQGNSWVPQDDQGNPVQYPITWTYSYEEGGETIIVPASGNAYNDTEYTATIRIPQDQANGIVFMSVLEGLSDTGYVKSIKRNDADGSATVVLTFDKTDPSGGDERPDVDIKLTVKGLDINDSHYIDSLTTVYHVLQGSEVILTAPDTDNEIFWQWDFGNTGITPVAGYTVSDKIIKVNIPTGLQTNELSIDAQYIPVINEIKASIKAPVAEQTMQTAADESTLKVTISNEYQIHPDYIQIRWTPEPLDDGGEKKADYLTPYTATISVSPKEDAQGKYIYAKGPDDADYKRLAARFDYSENLVATVNGENATSNKYLNNVNFTFPMTKYTLISVNKPEDISGVPHGADKAAIEKLLPATVKIVVSGGKELDAEVNWNSVAPESVSDPRDEIVWTAAGKVVLPDTVENTDGVSLDVSMKVTVLTADTAMTPEASLESGLYTIDQTTTITTRETGGTTYYTLDGSDPTTSSTRKVYNGEDIIISREDFDDLVDETTIDEEGKLVPTGRKMIVLSAYTEMSGLWDSAVVTYNYVFEKQEPSVRWVSVAKTWNDNDDQDKIRPESVTVKLYSSVGGKEPEEVKDAQGNPVTLELSEANDWWDYFVDLPEMDGDEVIKYTIEEVKTDVITGADGKGTYSIEITGNMEFGFEIINTHTPETPIDPDDPDDPDKPVDPDDPTPPAQDEYSIVYKLNGGTYNGSAEDIVEKYPAGTVITIHEAPVRDGYTFDYWMGSEYHPGDTYTVTEDHTLVAQWKTGGKSDPDKGKPYAGPDTGDKTNVWLYIAIMAVSFVAIIILIIIRRRKRNR